ncbi:hypothetical protein LCGC14_2440430 [marine sediment metagenome]|uniref:Rho termination factor-like N-terminal domain-containing protein n=1 Tax=marine sediment metagenome TaxID=412755 RepID=A0A0F9BJA4_9ZZZZ
MSNIRFLQDFEGVETDGNFYLAHSIVDPESVSPPLDVDGLLALDVALLTEEEVKAPDLESLSVKDLKAKAKELGLEGYSKLKAPELRDAIREAQVLEFEVVEAGEGPEEA